MPQYLNTAFVLITIKPFICHNNMVDESNLHDLCCFFYFLGQMVIISAGLKTARRMIVNKGNVRGIGKQGLFQQHTHIYHRARNATATEQL